ncbi:MAG: AsmA family protein [Segetibacter sp.]|nr:AsmA family protein [Segetibacter sp.]
MNKYLKYTLRGLGILVGLLVIAYIILYIYVSVNKKSIIAKVNTEISEKLNGDVLVENIELSFFTYFPEVSVVLEKVSIKDTMFNQHKHPFFQAEKVYARISAWKLIRQRDPLTGIRAKNASLYVYTDTSGYTNKYLFSPKKDSIQNSDKKPKERNILKDIRLDEVRLVMDDRRREKLIDVEINRMDCDIAYTDSTLVLSLENDFLIHGLGFNLDRGSYAKETTFEGDFDVVYNKNREEVSFKDIEVDLKGHPFVFTGLFSFRGDNTFSLKIVTEQVKQSMVKTILTPKIAKAISIVSVEEPLDASAEISGPLGPGEPLVKVNWKGKNVNANSPFFKFTNATFSGGYTNELIPGLPRQDENSRIFVNGFTGSYEGIVLRSDNIYIDNLVNPMINCDVKSNFPLASLNNLLGSNAIQLKQGEGSVNVVYSGPLQRNNRSNTTMNGSINIKNGTVFYAPRGISLTNCNGNIVFKGTDVFVNALNSTVAGSRILMNGVAKDMLAFMKTNPGKVALDWNVYSPSINLETFTGLLKQRTRVTPAKQGTAQLSSAAEKIDNMLDQANVNLDFKADNVTFRKFAATNVKASIGLIEDNYDLRNVSLAHGGGTMTINGFLHELSAKLYEGNLKVNMDNVDVHKVLYAFNNFGQDALKSENLRGKLTSSINVKMNIDRELNSQPSGITGFVDFSLKKGALLNFEPLKKLQNFMFKNRNFSAIYFAELKDRLDINGKDIIINELEIQSSALTLFVQGMYSLSPGKTDISIKIPIRNLKKRDENYVPTNTGKGGVSVFVRGTPGADGNIQFKYDPLGRFRKDK